MTHSAKSSELVRTIVMMAQNLGLGVVAEGVETEAHREQLSAFGCPYMQGYLFSEPLSSSQTTAFLQQTVSRTHSVLT